MKREKWMLVFLLGVVVLGLAVGWWMHENARYFHGIAPVQGPPPP